MAHRLFTPKPAGPGAGPLAEAGGAALAEAFAALREEFELSSGYPPAALADAEAAIASLTLPEVDATDVEFVTIDPPTSTDLDQALHIARQGAWYRVRYAIADVPAFVRPEGALDAETRRRGQTIYAADAKVPLHPSDITDDAGSLLPDETRGAFVWDFSLDGDGEVSAVRLTRARVRSRAKLDYAQVQEQIDAGSALEPLMLLKEVGLKRIELERRRGGASLNLPEQEIVPTDDGGYRIEIAAQRPVEDWNAQISLMTGMAAASLMLQGRVGILRTMPAPDEKSLRHFRRQTQALGNPWDGSVPYGEYLRSLDPTRPRQLAILHAAAALFRGASYTPFDGDLPADPAQAAIAAPYAHTTAPLRRLVDRFVLVLCEAIATGTEVPEWVRAALPDLPGLMAASDQLAGKVERASLDLVEAALLVHSVGQEFDAVVISGSKPAAGSAAGAGQGSQTARLAQPLDRIASSQNGQAANGTAAPAANPFGTVQLSEPPVTARCEGEMESGARVRVRLVTADVRTRKVLFELA
ncbi:ribonuclease R [Sinomonas cellulolyticus]|uniref:RNB domain-containing ribonuclease n=1 Tax=Sinomonas cellulolyticus TaxID=2801916 RepID=A0ABS1K023_9MICC|nr:MULTISPECIES: RNB domain-containing ribonuclease [Sinomonas]MBL0704823.1 RNB domain-containing ribonuclease [Sinomonas cellulolyticus]GHG47277.1 ribonuclease R [Sinomonas sp. KCTC 49339]